MDRFWAYASLLWSALTWAMWILGMFTDTRFGRAIRMGPSITKRRSDLTVFHPTWATVLMLVGITTLIEENDGPEAVRDILTGLTLIIILLALIIYWLPIRLPNWTDPYWHERQRAARRAQAVSDAEPTLPCVPASAAGADHTWDAPGSTTQPATLTDTSPGAHDLTEDHSPMTTTATQRFRGAVLELEAPESTVLVHSAAARSDEDAAKALLGSVPPSQLFGSSIDLALAFPRADAEPGWTDTLVTTLEDLPPELTEEAWQAALTTRTTQEIPGYQIIDISRWDGLSDATLIRTGLFILDERSLTTLQWTWTIPHPSTSGTRLGLSATFTCPTRNFDKRYEGFIDILNTVEVI